MAWKYRWVVILSCWLCGAVSANAQWTDAKKQAVTDYMHQFRQDWTLDDTELLLEGKVPHGAEANVFINNRPSNMRLKADDGRSIPIEVFGESILLNGKDISGNLGSKITHGANSPIIEDVNNSQISTGDKSPITQRNPVYAISISLSLALSLSVVANLYLLKKMRDRKLPATKGRAVV